MFSLERDASKVALARLCSELAARDFQLIDCQIATPHLLSLGTQLMPRTEFIELVGQYTSLPESLEPWVDPAPPH
jgi:leucyl/phenylalanyl-tRNA--protein transferase